MNKQQLETILINTFIECCKKDLEDFGIDENTIIRLEAYTDFLRTYCEGVE